MSERSCPAVCWQRGRSEDLRSLQGLQHLFRPSHRQQSQQAVVADRDDDVAACSSRRDTDFGSELRKRDWPKTVVPPRASSTTDARTWAKFRNMAPRRSRFLLISEHGSPGGTHRTGTHDDFLFCIVTDAAIIYYEYIKSMS